MRLPDLLNELAVAHGDGTLKKVIKAYQKIDLLILDEFLLSPVSTEQTRELLEIIEARSVKGSVIFCTQFEPKGWYSRIGNDCDATICEAIIDRIIHNSYEVMLDGRISMILSILVYTFFSRMFDLMLPPVAKHSIVVA